MELIALVVLSSWIVAFIYMSRIGKLSRDVEQLSAAVRELQARGVSQPVPTSERPVTAPPPAPVAARPAKEPALPATVPHVHVEETAPGPIFTPLVQPPARPSAPPPPSLLDRVFQSARTTDEWEALIGGRWLNRIGAVALILGAGFFLKYAFDHDWISPPLRVAIGLVAGAVLLALAYRSHGRGYAIFAQGLVGAGISILYLSVYASFNFYHLVAQPVALAGMGLVTVLAFTQALYYDSLAVSLLAWFGGFLAPILLMTEGASELGLAVYVALLVTGILVLTARKSAWFILEPLTMGAAYFVYILWWVKSYNADALPLAVFFVSILWVLFYARDVYDIIRNWQTQPSARQALGIFNSGMYYLLLFALLFEDHRPWMAAASVMLGAVYCATVLAVARRRPVEASIAARYALTSIVLLVLATTIQFSGFTVVILWALEALLLLGIGLRWRLWYVWSPALALYGLSACRLLLTTDAWFYTSVRQFHPVLNQRALAYLTLAAIAGVCAFLVAHRRDETLKDSTRRIIAHSLQYVCCTLPFIWLTVETNDFFRSQLLHAGGLDFDQLSYARFLAIGAVWTIYGTMLVWTGLRLKLTPVLLSGLGATALAAVEVMSAAVVYVPVDRFIPLLNARAGVMILLGVALFVQFRWLRSLSPSAVWLQSVRVCLQVTLLALGFEFITVEVNDYFRRLIAESHGLDATSYGFARTMIIAGLWTLYSLPIVRYGAWKRQIFVVAGGLCVAGLSVLVGAAAGLTYRPIEWFIPILNVRAAALLVILCGLFFHLRTIRPQEDMHRWMAGFVLAIEVTIVVLGFELASVEVRDFYENAIATGSRSMGTVDDLHNLQQLSLSVVWLLYAALLLGVGIWRRSRWLRFGALALFAVTIAKVFFYDLRFLGGAYRSISFAGLGVILLAVSFLYQRFKNVLFGTVEREEPKPPRNKRPTRRPPPHHPRPVS